MGLHSPCRVEVCEACSNPPQLWLESVWVSFTLSEWELCYKMSTFHAVRVIRVYVGSRP